MTIAKKFQKYGVPNKKWHELEVKFFIIIVFELAVEHNWFEAKI